MASESVVGGRGQTGAPKDILFPSPETLILQPYTQAEKKALKKEGAFFLLFSRQTIRDQIEAGKPFWYVLDAKARFKVTPSVVGEVAYFPDPKQFFLSGSNNATFGQQEEMIEAYGKDLRERLNLPDHVRAVMAQAPDYTQLAFTHFERTGEHLFGYKYGFKYTRTKTPIVPSDVVNVGFFSDAKGITLSSRPRFMGSDKLFVTPLLVSTVA